MQLRRLATAFPDCAPDRYLDRVYAELDKVTKWYHDELKKAAKSSLSCFVEYMTPDEPPALHHEYFCNVLEAIMRRDKLRVCLSCPPGHAKSVNVKEVVPTVSGFVSIEDLKVGDRIYGTDGKLTTVLAKSEVFHNPCFKATTSDGEEIIVSDDHLWTLRKRRGYPFETLTTREFYEWYQGQKDKRAFMLPKTAPVEKPHVSLKVDPYVLGAWLGDGTSKSGLFTVSDGDRAHLTQQLESVGYQVTSCGGITVYAKKLVTQLREIEVLNDKHIPQPYLNASVAQRMALLQGLMDTDGNCRDNGGCRFVNTNEVLIDQFRELLWSLGVPNTKNEMKVDPAYWGDGYTRSACWCVSFSGIECFRLPRKKAKLTACKNAYGRYITFTPCETVPTQCIAVDAPDELFLVGKGCVPTHNTKFWSRYFPAFYLGNNPNHRFLQGGHSQAFAENEFGKYVRDIILDPRYNDIFPDVTLNKRSGMAAGSWRIAGKRGAYVAKGAGQAIAGFRGHIGGIDDPFGSREDAQSQAIREKTGKWLFTDFRTRLLPHSPLYIVATRWHPDDLIGRVEQMSRMNKGLKWEIINLPAIIESEEEMAMDPMGRGMGEALWPEYYTVNEMYELKATLPAGDWQALYKGQPRDAEGNVVKGGWFQRYDRLPTNGIIFNEAGAEYTERRVKRITLSVDCANKTTARSNYTVITVWVEDLKANHYLAHVLRRKIEFTEIATEINRLAEKWGATVALVENAGAGIQLLQQYAGKLLVPLIPIETNSKSKEFRFDGVTPMIEAGEVWLPKSAPWLSDYEEEVLAFPTGSADDQVDSTSQYLAWARKRSAYGTKKLKGVGHKHGRRR